MKVSIFLLLFLLFSCEQKSHIIPIQKMEKQKSEISDNFQTDELFTSQPWFQYYQKENPNFKPELFQFQEKTIISKTESSAIILNEKGFDTIYKPFFIFNESGTQYLDFDSYNWFVDSDGNAGFDVDQQVDLVDMKKKKAERIAFFGASYWVEDAYWKGDSIAVLLGNTYDKIPFIIRFNFDQNTRKLYKYSDTLQFETDYSTIRLKRKGIKID